MVVHACVKSNSRDVVLPDGRLLRIAFTTVFDYLFLLRVVAQELQVRIWEQP